MTDQEETRSAAALRSLGELFIELADVDGHMRGRAPDKEFLALCRDMDDHVEISLELFTAYREAARLAVRSEPGKRFVPLAYATEMLEHLAVAVGCTKELFAKMKTAAESLPLRPTRKPSSSVAPQA